MRKGRILYCGPSLTQPALENAASADERIPATASRQQ